MPRRRRVCVFSMPVTLSLGNLIAPYGGRRLATQFAVNDTVVKSELFELPLNTQNYVIGPRIADRNSGKAKQNAHEHLHVGYLTGASFWRKPAKPSREGFYPFR